VEVTGANVHDLDAADRLIRKDDEFVNADAGYTGIEKRDGKVYKDPMNHLDYIGQPNWDGHIEYKKSKVRCKVEHVFAVVKGKFGYRKAVYRGLKKNKVRLYMLFFSANLLRWTWTLA
jgi:IS5 family transposase